MMLFCVIRPGFQQNGCYPLLDCEINCQVISIMVLSVSDILTYMK